MLGEVRVNARLLDRIEQICVTLFFIGLIVRLLPHDDKNWTPFDLMPLASEGLVLIFTLLRRPSEQVSRNLGDWLLAVGATCLPLTVAPGGTSLSVVLGGLLGLVGFLCNVAAKLSLGRSFGILPANRGVKHVGPYRFVRHPMYAGYVLGHIGFLLVAPTWWNLSVYAMALVLQLFRLQAEERLLSVDPGYRDYSARVRYRLVPGLY